MNLQYISNKHGEQHARKHKSANELRLILPSLELSLYQFDVANFTIHFGWITATENDTLVLSALPCRFWYFGMLHNSMMMDIPGGGSCLVHETGVQYAFSPQCAIALRVERAEEYGFFFIKSTRNSQPNSAVARLLDTNYPRFLFQLPKVWKTSNSVDVFSIMTTHLKQQARFFPHKPIACSSTIRQLFANIASCSDQGKFLSVELARNTYQQLRALLSLAHLSQPVDLLLVEAGISDVLTFKKHVKKIYGCSVTELLYIEKSRLAALMLKRNDLAIKEVAAKSGFANIHHFTRYFTQRYKTSPKKYREQFGI